VTREIRASTSQSLAGGSPRSLNQCRLGPVSSAAAATPPAASLAREGLRYLPVGFALLAIQLDFFSLNLALPHIAKEFDAPVTDLQWLLSGYMLSLGALFIPAVKLGDSIGRKRVVVIGLIVFGVLSLAAGLATDPWTLIAFRVLQGIGAGLVMPNAFALVGATTHESVRARVMGILLAIAGIGTALGPVLGGVFAATVGWRWLFFINVPIAAISLAFAKWVPEYFVGERRGGLRAVDWPGAILVSFGIALASVGVDNITNLGWTSPLTWGPFVVGVVLLAVFAWHIRRAAAPLIAPSLFRDGKFMIVALAGTVLNLSVAVVIFSSTLQLQNVDGFSPDIAGLLFLGCSIGVAIAGPVAGWLTSRFSAISVLNACLAIDVVAILAVAFTSPCLPVYVVALGLAGFAGGMGWSVAQVGGQQLLPAERSGEGAGLMSMVMVTGGGISVVVAGVVIEAIAGGGTPTTPSITWLNVGLALLVALLAVVTIVAVRRRPARV